MKKSVLDHYSWACSYSIYHPVFYSCTKTNYTPSHVFSWPIKKIYSFRDQNIPQYYNQKEKGDFRAFEQARDYPKVAVEDKSRRILLKRLSSRNDIPTLSNILSGSEVTADDYYMIAKCIMHEGTVSEIMGLVERGLKSSKAPSIGLLGEIMGKAVQEKDYKTCQRIWELVGFLERDSRVERIIMLKLSIIEEDKDLIIVYYKVLKWNALTTKVKRGILECAHRISSPYLQDWMARFKMSEECKSED
jgi:hypothetical protein